MWDDTCRCDCRGNIFGGYVRSAFICKQDAHRTRTHMVMAAHKHTVCSCRLSDIPPAALGFVLGFGAGTFLYITCTAIIPELVRARDSFHVSTLGVDSKLKVQFEAKQFRTLSLVGLAVGYVGFVLFESLVHAH